MNTPRHLRPERREYMRKWWLAHPDYRKNHYLANKERWLELDRKWKKENSEKSRAFCRKYYQRTRRKQIERVSLWGRLNPEKRKAFKSISGARRRAKTKLGKDKRITALYKRCQELRQWFEVVVDHIVPLSRGGLHELDNLQIIYAQENNRKHTNINHQPKVIFI